jgi:NADPH-dependent curcumin reductase CurA
LPGGPLALAKLADQNVGAKADRRGQESLRGTGGAPMPSNVNRQIILKSRPHGMPSEQNFELVEAAVPEPGSGQFVARTIYLSLDPYMRGRMSERASYASPAELNRPMVGGTVGQVVRSSHPGYCEGDFVVGYWGWQEYGRSDGASVRKLDPTTAPLSYALGVLGMPGMTAYVALLDIGKPRPGETVVVSAAAGAVGSVVGQIARILGCKSVGIAGTDAKCRYVVEELGFDACLNYKTQDLDRALAEACPSGIDIYYENVGGTVTGAVLRHINRGARIPLVGLISQYNATEPPPGPNLVPLLFKRALVQGFIVSDHPEREEDFLRNVSAWLKAGKLKNREHIVEGLENAPRAFFGLFTGENFGKLIVRASPDPTRAEHDSGSRTGEPRT